MGFITKSLVALTVVLAINLLDRRVPVAIAQIVTTTLDPTATTTTLDPTATTTTLDPTATTTTLDPTATTTTLDPTATTTTLDPTATTTTLDPTATTTTVDPTAITTTTVDPTAITTTTPTTTTVPTTTVPTTTAPTTTVSTTPPAASTPCGSGCLESAPTKEENYWHNCYYYGPGTWHSESDDKCLSLNGKCIYGVDCIKCTQTTSGGYNVYTYNCTGNNYETCCTKNVR